MLDGNSEEPLDGRSRNGRRWAASAKATGLAAAFAVVCLGLVSVSRYFLQSSTSPVALLAAKTRDAHGQSELARLGQDAMNLWGAWDGLSPVPKAPSSISHHGQRRHDAHRSLGPAGIRVARHSHQSRGRNTALSDEAATPEVESAQDLEDERSRFFRDLIERAAPFPYVWIKLSVHGVQELLGIEEVDDIRQAVADSVRLSTAGSPELRAALGEEPVDWVVIESTKALNCSVPHACDDRGRRRRLLSVSPARRPAGRPVRAPVLADEQALLGARAQVAQLKGELAAARRGAGAGPGGRARTSGLGFIGHWRDAGYVPGSHYDVKTEPWVPRTTKTAKEIAADKAAKENADNGQPQDGQPGAGDRKSVV